MHTICVLKIGHFSSLTSHLVFKQQNPISFHPCEWPPVPNVGELLRLCFSQTAFWHFDINMIAPKSKKAVGKRAFPLIATPWPHLELAKILSGIKKSASFYSFLCVVKSMLMCIIFVQRAKCHLNSE